MYVNSLRICILQGFHRPINQKPNFLLFLQPRFNTMVNPLRLQTCPVPSPQNTLPTAVLLANLVSFGTELCSLACDSLEAGFDAGHGAAGVAGLALQEVEPRVLLQDGVGGAARVAGDVLFCREQRQSALLLLTALCISCSNTPTSSQGMIVTLEIAPG